MKTIKVFVSLGLIVVLLSVVVITHAQGQNCGAFSSYLVGTFETRLGIVTVLQIINPTQVDELKVVIAFFDENGNYLACEKNTLDQNDMWEISLTKNYDGIKAEDKGVVKIISYEGTGGDKVSKPGIVGFQTQVNPVAGAQTILASVPDKAIADGELKVIFKDVNCPE